MYTEVYNFYKDGWLVFGFPLIIFLIVVFFWVIIKYGDVKEKDTIGIHKIALPFGILIFLASLVSCSIDYFKTLKIANNETYNKVEGVIYDYIPDTTGHQSEDFKVKGVQFAVHGSSNPSVGYNRTALDNSPIRNGKTVRIYYFNDLILFLWIKN